VLDETAQMIPGKGGQVECVVGSAANRAQPHLDAVFQKFRDGRKARSELHIRGGTMRLARISLREQINFRRTRPDAVRQHQIRLTRFRTPAPLAMKNGKDIIE